MITFPDIPLPTLDRAGIISLPAISPADALSIARTWLATFSSLCLSSDTDGILGLFHPSIPFWRDILALTWDLRTFFGTPRIAAFLQARLADVQLNNCTLVEMYTAFQQLFPDLAWVNLMFKFTTKVGSGTGVVKLVPLRKNIGSATDDSGNIQSLDEIEWKAHIVLTNLDSLTDFPEKIGPLRDFEPNRMRWAAQRETAAEFLGAEEDEAKGPKVLVIGAGQSGLDVAVRLKALGVPALVIDKNDRIGDNWRKRYEALCLHDPVWYDHMPYLPFPPTWPVFCPSQKLANWLEHYADTFELSVWMSSTISFLSQEPQTDKWHVTINRRRVGPNGQLLEQERKFIVKHVVFCTGLGSPNPPMPTFPGMDAFEGQILHSTRYKRAVDHQGKKVVVVGACTSAHDISEDCYEQGVGMRRFTLLESFHHLMPPADVTIIQRGSTYIMSTTNGFGVMMKDFYSEESPPADVSDILFASFPIYAITEISRRQTQFIAVLDKDILDSLHEVGFRTNLGYEGTGLMPMVLDKAGGYYLDTGASKLIGDRKIKLKSDSQISHFTERAIVFENGSELEADVVVFATGIGDTLDNVATILSDSANAELIKKLKPIWGVDAEGEVNGAWAYNKLGVPGLWYMLGNLAMCRFYSMRIALQIKAMEEGIWSGVYEG